MPSGVPAAGPSIDAELQTFYDMVGMYKQDAPEGHDAQLAYNLYWLLMDWDSRNAVGVEPLKQLTDKVEAISSIEEMSRYLVETPSEEQIHSVWQAGGTVNFNDSSSMIFAVMPKELMLGDAGEYTQETQLGTLTREATGVFVQKMLVKLGYTEEEAAAKYQNCLDFEGMLAPAMYPDSVKSQIHVCPTFTIPAAQGRDDQGRWYDVHIQNPQRFRRLIEHYAGYPLDDYIVDRMRRPLVRPGMRRAFEKLLRSAAQPPTQGMGFCPTMALTGGRDPLIDDARQALIAELLSDAETHNIRSAGHFPMETHSKAMRDYLRGWLRYND
jgi:hypothetical protein